MFGDFGGNVYLCREQRQLRCWLLGRLWGSVAVKGVPGGPAENKPYELDAGNAAERSEK